MKELFAMPGKSAMYIDGVLPIASITKRKATTTKGSGVYREEGNYGCSAYRNIYNLSDIEGAITNHIRSKK